MPVTVGRCGEKWCVKEPDGSTVAGGEHDTEAEAQAHASAINANVEKAVPFTQAETSFLPASDQEGRRCGLCRFFFKDNADNPGRPCLIVEPEPETITENGLCTAFVPLPTERREHEDDEQNRRSHKKWAVKMKGENEFAGYTVVWGNPEERDLQGEFFTPETDLALEAYPVRPLIYHHGHNQFLQRTIIGTITSWKSDDIGLYVEGNFKRLSDDVDLFDEEERQLREEYIRKIQDKIERGELNFSSGAVSHLCKMDDHGRITQWWWAESSATGSPAEPRMTDVHLLRAMRGFKFTIPEAPALPAIEDNPPVIGISEPNDEPEEVNEMTVEEVIALLLSQIDEMEGIAPEVKEQIMAALTALIEEQTATLRAEDDDEDEDEEDKTEDTPTTESELIAILNNPEMLAQLIGKAKAMVNPAITPAMVTSSFKAANVLTQQPPRGSGGVPVPGYAPIPSPTPHMFTKTNYEQAGWTPDDYIFFYELQKVHNPLWSPPVEFAREAAEVIGKDRAKYFQDDNAHSRWERDRAFAKVDELEYTSQVGYGAEWMPQAWDTTVREKVRVENRVLQLLRPVNMPTSPFNLPLEGTDPTVYAVPETNDQAELSWPSHPITMSKVGTRNATMTAGKLGVLIGMSDEEIEDINLNVVQFKRQQTQKTINEAIEAVLLSADSDANGNINYNGAALAATSRFRYGGGDGLLHLPLRTTVTLAVPAGSEPTLRQMWDLQKLLSEAYGITQSDLAYIIDVRTWQSFRNDEDLLTVDKYGNDATVLTGEVAKIGDVPIIVTNQMPLAANDGSISNTAGNNTKGRTLLIYRPNWYVGFRRQTQLETFVLPFGGTVIQATLRMALSRFDNASASLLFNITV